MKTREELEAELALLQSNTPAVSGEVVDPPSNGLELVIHGEAFQCRRVSTTWQMMKFAKARQAAAITIPKGMPEGPKRTELEEKRNEAGMAMLATLRDTAMVLLKPGERARFEAFMDELSESEDGLDNGELENAIGTVIAAAGDEAGKAEASPTVAHSSNGSPTTNESVRVISSSKVMPEDALPAKTY